MTQLDRVEFHPSPFALSPSTISGQATLRSSEVEGQVRNRIPSVAFTLYILECSDGTLYTGHTDNLDERMRQHDAGKADAYTSKRHPLKLLHAEEFETRYEALTMERKLKGWSRPKKLAYIAGDWNAVSRLARNHQVSQTNHKSQ